MKKKKLNKIICAALVLAMVAAIPVGAAEEVSEAQEEIVLESETSIEEAGEEELTEEVLTEEAVAEEEASAEEVVSEEAEEAIVAEETEVTTGEVVTEEEITEESIVVDEAKDAVVDKAPATEEKPAADKTETKEVEEKEVEAEDALANEDGINGVKIIVGSADFDVNENSIEVDVDNKPAAEELVKKMPKSLKLRVKGSNDLEDVAVTWSCVGDDFNTSEGYYFQFSPNWNEDEYILDSKLSKYKDLPYISVFVKPAKPIISEDGEIQAIFAASVTGKSQESQIYSYLTNELGLSRAAACGVLANIQYESGFRPDIYGDNGTSFGICQWHASRLTNLKNYCQKNGYDYTTVDGQLNFLKYELNNTYSSVYSRMRSISNTADGSYEAGYIWCIQYEVPANKEEKAITRGNLAKNTYWAEYSSKTPDGDSSDDDDNKTATGLKQGWFKYQNYTFYIDSSGKPVTNKWLQISGKWYYFDVRGVMQKGVFSVGGKVYVCGQDGARLTRWQKANGKTYYLHPTEGYALKDWQKVNGKWYYLDPSNYTMVTGWKKVGKVWYYLDKSTGAMATGWVKDGGKWYYLNTDGSMKTGWLKLGSKKYYLKSDGSMVTGWKTIKSKKYYFNKSGEMKKGWVTVKSKKYYLGNNGVMVTGWKTISGKKYYFDINGKMAKGWKTIEAKRYYFKSSGVLQTGWFTYEGNRYYLRANTGEMATGWLRINGVACYFGADGIFDPNRVYTGGSVTPTPTPVPGIPSDEY